WLPDAYQTAPIGVSMVLTGVLSKMGVYGFVRLLLPLFPYQIKIIGPWILALAICLIVFAPLAALAQRDLIRMVATLSINHIAWSPGTERIYRRVSDFQRLIRNRSRIHSRCYNRSSRHSHRFYASDAIAL